MVPKRIKGAEATRLFRRISLDLRWCDNCNSPIVSEDVCPVCGERTRIVKVVPPGDVRLAFAKDISDVRSAIARYAGDRAAKILVPEGSFVLLNRVQAIDVAYEIVVDGYSIGLVSFDPLSAKWLFKPMYYGALLVAESGVCGYVIADRFRPGKVLDRSSVRVEGEIPEKFVVVVSSDGSRVGLAKVIRRGYAVVKVWKIARPPPLGMKRASIHRAIECNSRRLSFLEDIAKRRVRKAMKLGKTFVTVSGGKDSAVAAYIANLCGVRNFVFVDTGLELPETYAAVDKLEKVLGTEIDRIGDPRAFWREVNVLGPPARDYRWCSRVCKLTHLTSWCRSHGCSVSIVGQRRYESASRALSGPIAPSGSQARSFVVAPIHEWSSLEVMLFSISREIPLNELYMKGFDRVGCFMCPTSRLAEFEHVKEVNRDRWLKWIGVLEIWRRKWGLPKEWIDLGLWRWRFSYPAEVKHVSKLRGVDADRIVTRILGSYGVLSYEASTSGLYVKIVMKGFEASVDRLVGALKAVGFRVSLIEDERVLASDNIVGCRAHRNYLEIMTRGEAARRSKVIRALKRVIRAWFFSTGCIRCSLCEYVCHRGAVKRGMITVENCSSCARCVFICPRSMMGDYVLNLLVRELKL